MRNSSPFYDSSYMPELMYESQSFVTREKPGGFKLLGYQVGCGTSRTVSRDDRSHAA
jgi:hypothetical protein